MDSTALFLGRGNVSGPGALCAEACAESVEFLTQLKAEGEIEDFQTVLPAPHGGELDGLILIYGEPEKLATLQLRDALNRLQMRARLDHPKFSVICLDERLARVTNLGCDVDLVRGP